MQEPARSNAAPTAVKSRRWIVGLLISAVVFTTAVAAWKLFPRIPDITIAKSLFIVASGDTAGWIEPCGCTSNQSGGLARRATFVNKLKKRGDVLTLEVGGAPGGTSDYDRLKFRAILRGEMAMGTAAHNIGRAEAALGPAELRRLADETMAPFVSTNLRAADGESFASPLRIISLGGRRIAVLGVLSPKLAPAELHATDPRSAVVDALHSAKGAYDLSVVLAYLPPAELEALAANLPEADFVIGGPTGQTIAPRRIGPTWLTAVTNKAKFVAKFEVLAGRASRDWRESIVELNAQYADDPGQRANVDDYIRQLVEHDFLATQTSFAL